MWLLHLGIRVHIMQLLSASGWLLRLLSAIIICYCKMRWWAFWSLLGHILNDFKNRLDRFLVFWNCFSVFLSPNVLDKIHKYFTFELKNNIENTWGVKKKTGEPEPKLENWETGNR